MVKNLLDNAGDVRDEALIPGSGRSPGEGNGNPLQCFCLENPMDGGAWKATVHGVAKSRTRLNEFTFFHFHTYIREGHGNPLQDSCLENPMDRGAWQTTVHEVARVRHDLATKPPPSLEKCNTF